MGGSFLQGLGLSFEAKIIHPCSGRPASGVWWVNGTGHSYLTQACTLELRAPPEFSCMVPELFLFLSQNRTDQQCQYRWLRVLNPDLVKGPWTKEEDQKVSVG